MTYEVAWQEFSKSGQLVTKRKEFKTETAMQKFIEKHRTPQGPLV